MCHNLEKVDSVSQSSARDCTSKGCRIVQILYHHRCLQNVRCRRPCPLFQYRRVESDDIHKRDMVSNEGRGKHIGGEGEKNGVENA